MNTRVVWLYFDLTMNDVVLGTNFVLNSICITYKEIIIDTIIEEMSEKKNYRKCIGLF